MKNFVIGLGVAVLAVFGVLALKGHSQPTVGGGGSGIQFFYTSATTASSSVTTTWTTSPVLAADSQRGYVSFCNDNTVSGGAIYLGMGATSTGVSGIKIAANSCYEMTMQRMFYGNVYAIASPTTTTLLMVTGKY